MPLQQQTQAFPLYGGIDTKTDPKYVPVTSLLIAQNVRFPANQQAAKRYGQTLLPSASGGVASPLTAGKALASFGSELLAYDGSDLKTYAAAQGAWIERASLTESEVARTPVVRSAGNITQCVSVLSSNDEVYAWVDADLGGVYYAARDSISGTFAVSPTVVDSAASFPTLVVCGTYVVLFYLTGANLYVRTMPRNSPGAGFGAPRLLRANAIPGCAFAAAALQSDAGIELLLNTSGGWHRLSLSLTLVIVADAAQTAGPVTALYAVLQPSGVGTLCFYAASGTPGNLLHGGSDGAAGFADTLPNSTGRCAFINNAGPVLLFDRSSSSSMPAVGKVDFAFPFATPVNTFGLQLASLVYYLAGLPYFVASTPAFNRAGTASQQQFFLLVRADTMGLVQRFSAGSAYNATGSMPLPAVDGDALFLGLLERTALRVSPAGAVYASAGITATRFTFPSTTKLRVVPFGNTALVNCGNTYTYDGSKVVEAGFWEFPDGITASHTPAGSGISAGTYLYAACYQWTDAAGNTHYSAPSYPSPVVSANTFGVTTAAGDSVTLTVPYTALTLRSDAVVVLYRTLVNKQGPFYRLPTGTVPNRRDGTASFTFTDTASDADILGQPFLYAPPDGSGELEDDAPPPFLYVVGTKTRIFGIAEDDRTALWYSKPLVPGRPAEFSGTQILRVETDGGAVTGLGALDDNCVVFKTARTYYVPGQGPNTAGQPANGFPPTPVLISSTSGCTNPASILSTHSGVFFKSATGIQVLNRSLSTDYNIGLPVQGVNALTLTGAQIVPAQNQLRWTSAEGTALVFDYVLGRWSTYSNYAAVGYTSYGATFARLTSGGSVFYEDTSLYTDNLQPVPMVLETSWFKSAGTAQGWAAVWYAEILGTFVSNHSLQIDVYYDYLPTSAQTAYWNAASNEDLYGADSPYGTTTYYGNNALLYTEPYQPRIALQRQVCESIKFRITDTAQNGASCLINEVALQLGVIGGLNRVPTGQQV